MPVPETAVTQDTTEEEAGTAMEPGVMAVAAIKAEIANLSPTCQRCFVIASGHTLWIIPADDYVLARQAD